MKKALSLVLSVLLVLGVLPFAAAPARAAIIDSGTCDDNLTWTLDDTGTLTISGSGKMDFHKYDIYNGRQSPWCNNTAIHTVVIQNGVTSIDGGAFSGCTGLTSVTIPDSVTIIGGGGYVESEYYPPTIVKQWSGAFSGCTGLTSVMIPDSVTSIGAEAFSGCTGLTSVTIGNGVKSIGFGAFFGCTGLTSVTIPDSVTDIGGECYSEFDVGYYEILNRWRGAFFGCTGLTSVTIGNGVKRIGAGAFSGCVELANLTVDANNPVYCSAGNCIIEKESKTLVLGCKNSVIPGDGSVTSIEGGVKLWDGWGYMSFICWGAFNGCTGLTSVTIPHTVTSIGMYAFYNCTGLTSVTIPDSVTSIGEGAFSGCTGLEKVNISDVAKWCAMQFDGDASNPLSYAHHLYVNGGEVTELTIPHGVASIGKWAFNGCAGLTSVTIPHTVTSIGMYAFYNCTGLEDVYYDSSEAQWWSIDKTFGNGDLVGAVRHYNEPRYNTWDGGVITTASTCTTGGVKTYTCTVCGATKTETVGKTGHSYGAWAKLDDAQHQRVCANDKTHVEKENHKWNNGVVTTAATCTKDGVKTYTCTVCNATKTETINATGHNYGAWAKLNDTQHQRVCANDKSHVEKENHAWNVGVITTAATCTADGVKTYTCAVCNATRAETINATGHSYGAWAKLNDTQHQRVCANDKSHVEKENHAWDGGVVTTAATCTTDGVKTYTCTVCGVTKIGTIPAAGHSYGAWAKLNDTQHQRVCANDNTHVEKANHMWNGGVITTTATCTKDGVKTFFCSVCGATKTETIPATGHKAVTDEAVPATCTEDGKTEGSHCSVCGEVLKAQETVAAGHRWSDWIRLDNELHRRVCTNDPTHVETEKHTWDEGTITKIPTCASPGEITYYCTTCGTAISVPGEAATGHVWGKWTNLNETQHKRVCANDPTHVDTAEHIWDEGKITKQPTAEEEGERTLTCTACGATKTEPIPKAKQERISGDVDGDGKLTSADARLALRASVGLEPDITAGSDAYLAADADGDGKVTSGDARLILRASVGLEDPKTFGKKA